MIKDQGGGETPTQWSEGRGGGGNPLSSDAHFKKDELLRIEKAQMFGEDEDEMNGDGKILKKY